MIIQPFLTYYRDHKDYNSSDAEQECSSMIRRNTAIQEYVSGAQDSDYMLNVLEAEGIDPEAYIENVQSEIEYLIANPQELYDC